MLCIYRHICLRWYFNGIICIPHLVCLQRNAQNAFKIFMLKIGDLTSAVYDAGNSPPSSAMAGRRIIAILHFNFFTYHGRYNLDHHWHNTLSLSCQSRTLPIGTYAWLNSKNFRKYLKFLMPFTSHRLQLFEDSGFPFSMHVRQVKDASQCFLKHTRWTT